MDIKMATYRVEVPYILWVSRVVEANDEEHAIEVAMECQELRDGLDGSLIPQPGTRIYTGEGSAEGMEVPDIGVDEVSAESA
jgi:hypothetical protein